MDLLLQVSEKELEEFPEPPVDYTDQDKPDRTNTGGTQSSNISHQLQTQTQTSTASEASILQKPLILVTLKTHPMEGHMDTIPWIPYHPTLWTS